MPKLALALVLLAPLTAASGPNKTEREARFVQHCEAVNFTPAQCGFLLALAENSASD